jgi:hypothetical protein
MRFPQPSHTFNAYIFGSVNWKLIERTGVWPQPAMLPRGRGSQAPLRNSRAAQRLLFAELSRR